jgi:hypothetical protein
MDCYRQGDVLVVRVGAVPKATVPVPREAGRLVLAHGEVTGHAHAIFADDAELVTSQQADDQFLQVYGEMVELVHEEHDTICLPRGTYRVVRQREYAPGEVRRVTD